MNKLGEYSSEVQFILQKSEKSSSTQNGIIKNDTKSKIVENGNGANGIKSPGYSRKEFTALDKSTEQIGIVKGIPQPILSSKGPEILLNTSSSVNNNKPTIINNNNLNNNHQQYITSSSTSSDQLNNDSSSSLQLGKERSLNFSSSSSENANLSNENLLDLYNTRLNTSNHSNVISSSPITSSSTVGVAGSLKPPAYRNPPPPKSTTQSSQKHNQNQAWNNNESNLNGNFSPILSPNIEMLMHSVQYRDLVQLIKFQREKINSQQAELTKVIYFKFCIHFAP